MQNYLLIHSEDRLSCGVVVIGHKMVLCRGGALLTHSGDHQLCRKIIKVSLQV
jgi:hypothetical protein